MRNQDATGPEGLAGSVLANLLEGCQVIGPDFRYLYVNDAAAAHGRTTRAQLLGRTMMEAYPGIETTEMFALLRRCNGERSPAQMENEFTFPDGSKGWFELRFEPVPDGVAILSVAISARKKTEIALRRSTRALTALSRCNQTLVRAADERQFMEDVCRVVVEHGGYRMAWIGMKDGDGEQAVRPVASAGHDEGYTVAAREVWSDTERGAGPTGLAIRTGKPAVARFIATDPEFEPWRRDALERGFASCIELPIKDNGSTLGALTIYASEPDAFHEEEQVLLEEMALDLGYGIATLRTRVSHKQAEREREMVVVFLRLVNDCTTTRELVERSVRFFREELGFEAVGIRLQEGDDFPYYEARGFPEEFIRLENSLCRRDEHGAVVRDGDLNPLLDCMCGNVIRGRVDPKKPFFTPAGSFWSNCTTGLLASTTDKDRLARTRNRCNGEGYESVGLFALRSGEQCLGLLQLNDRRQERFTPESLALHERLAGHLAVALAKTRADEDLVRSAERWQATFDAISDVVCVVSNDHKFIEINQAGCRSLGISRDQIIGRRCFEVVHGTGSPITACPCRLAAQSGEPATTRHQERGRTYDLLAWPLVGADRRSNGFVHIVKDVTAEVEATKEKTQLEEQLKLAQRLEAVGRLAGGVAHDFNNLLSVIISYAGFAVDELRESDPVRADIVEIQSAGQRAAALTRQLLAFSRKQLLEPEVLNLNRTVSGIESMLRRLLGEDIDIEVHLADDLGSVLADPGQIEQVIMNLSVNARDAMPQGGKLTIETVNVELDAEYADQHVAVKPGRFVMLSVTDTGTGMDAATREHIFEPFFTTKEKGKGTGLGLSTVYGIVKQSGGYIWVYSEPGRGTTFKVYLPRVDAPAAEARRRAVSAMPTGSETVLVVEDEDAVRRLAERILRSAGYEVLSAASGGDALVLCEKHGGGVDLLLTDVVMPQMSGRELAERLSKLCPRLKVLYMSGYTDNAIVHHGVLDPGTRFLGKPFAAAELTRKVREVLDEGNTAGG